MHFWTFFIAVHQFDYFVTFSITFCDILLHFDTNKGREKKFKLQ